MRAGRRYRVRDADFRCFQRKFSQITGKTAAKAAFGDRVISLKSLKYSNLLANSATRPSSGIKTAYQRN
jgi:hypothetical protein